MKKVLAFLSILLILPMARVFAADTPDIVNSTESDDIPHYDEMEQELNEAREESTEKWESKGNKELNGEGDEKEFSLSGLMKSDFLIGNDMLPGDTVSHSIRIKNSSKYEYNLSLSAVRNKEDIAKEHDLFEKLNLKIYENGKVVYDGKIFYSIVDDKTSKIDKTNQKIIDLGVVKPGKDNAVIFKAEATLDPSTTYEYANKSAKVQWDFIASEGPENNPGSNSGDNPSNNPGGNPGYNPGSNPQEKPGGSNQPSGYPPATNVGNNISLDKDDIPTVDLAEVSGKGEYRGRVSKTGDNKYIFIYILLACGCVTISYVLFSKKDKNGKEH